MRRPGEVHIHDADQVLLGKFDLLDSYLIDFSILYPAELLRHLVVVNVALNDLLKRVNFWVVLQLIFDMEGKLLNFLIDKYVDLSVNLLHLELNLFILDRLELFPRRLSCLRLLLVLQLVLSHFDEFCDRFNALLLLLYFCDSRGSSRRDRIPCRRFLLPLRLLFLL